MTTPARIPSSDIPGGAMVSCPGLSQSAVRVSETCVHCRFFGAIMQTNSDERLPWEQRHNMVCKYPRRLPMVAVRDSADAFSELETRSVWNA